MPAPTRAAAAAKKEEEQQKLIAPPSETHVAAGIILRQYKSTNGEWDTDRLLKDAESGLTKEEFETFRVKLSASILKRLQPLGVVEMTMAPWHTGGLKGKMVTGCTFLGATVVAGLVVEAIGYALDIPSARPSTYIARIFV